MLKQVTLHPSQKVMPISSEITASCDGCGKRKKVRMFVIQTGDAAWICAECRSGPPKPETK